MQLIRNAGKKYDENSNYSGDMDWSEASAEDCIPQEMLWLEQETIVDDQCPN